MQIPGNFVPPILFTGAPACADAPAAPSSVSPLAQWRFVVCQVLPDFARTAAARFDCPATSRTHLPCSQLHARLAGVIADAAGRLLPCPFTPHRQSGGSALCCGCSHAAIAASTPPLAVSWGNRSGRVASSRWELGSSSTGVHRQRRLGCLEIGC